MCVCRRREGHDAFHLAIFFKKIKVKNYKKQSHLKQTTQHRRVGHYETVVAFQLGTFFFNPIF